MEQEIAVKFILNLYRELFKQQFVGFSRNSLRLIIVPLEYKMLLYPLLKRNSLISVSDNLNIAIELFNNPKELGQVVCIVKLCVQILILFQNLNEVACP